MSDENEQAYKLGYQDGLMVILLTGHQHISRKILHYMSLGLKVSKLDSWKDLDELTMDCMFYSEVMLEW